MCGICGLYYFSRDDVVEKDRIQRMARTLSHRGPDDEGVYLDGRVGLGHRRLSIIDLSTGRQPISNEDGSVWTVFNGEIYNFLEIRNQLIEQGHQFQTQTDTEILVHGYEQYGVGLVEKLNGMFAFAIWDAQEQRLVLVRDRLGIKPLFYHRDNSRLIFGSEVKSVLASGLVPKDIDPDQLPMYLSYGYLPNGATMFRDIHQLPPAHMLVCEPESMHIERYWDLDQIETNESLTEEEAIEQIGHLFRESVRRRLMSDVPLGAFLSGGLDSSAVVGLMSQLMDQPVKTFSIGFEVDEYNELNDARRIADHFGTEHHELIIRPDAIDLLPKLISAFDEPFADSSAIPTYYVSEFARQHVTVALSGDGGDELFAGYKRYLTPPRDERFLKLPTWVRSNLVGQVGQWLPTQARAKEYFSYISQPELERYLARRCIYPPWSQQKLLATDMWTSEERDVAYRYAHQRIQSKPHGSFLEKMLYLDTVTYLPFDILTKVDRMSMLHSLEARVPMLDHTLVEYAAKIPERLKLSDGQGKHIFRKTISSWLPSHVFQKKKHGFALPLEHWFRKELRDLVSDVLATSRQRDYFNAGYIQHLLDDHQKGIRNHSARIWTLLVFEMWHQHYLGR